MPDILPSDRAGWRTTEFWITLGVQLLGSAVTTGVIPTGSYWERIAAMLLMAASAFGYAYSRGVAKRN